MMRILRLIVGYVLLLILMLNLAIITQPYLPHIPIAPWELWLAGISVWLGLVAALLQVDILRNLLTEAIKHIWDWIKSLASWIWKWPTKQKVASGILIWMVTILVLLHSLGFYTISISYRTPAPAVPLSLADRICYDEQKQGLKDGIGVLLKGEDCIGISNGNAIFDLNHDQKFVPNLVNAANESSKDSLGSLAQAGWSQAILDDPANAEPAIYYEDMQVQRNSYHRYVTLIVAAVLTGQYSYDGRDTLQGVYLQQKEHNENCRNNIHNTCVLHKVLIANIGSGKKDESDYAKPVADQMVDAIAHDTTIVGVMSGVTSQATVYISNELNEELPKRGLPKIPVVASKATDDGLPTDYLFRVVPPNTVQAQTAADFAKNRLHEKRVAILYRSNNIYGLSLEEDFSRDFPSSDKTYQLAGPSIGYDPQSSDSIYKAVENVLKFHPDILYCACYAVDINTILQWLARHNEYNNLPILGGDAFYGLVGSTPDMRSQWYRLYFTAFTYPDLWYILKPPGIAKPQGIEDYHEIYKANVGDGIYGHTRMTPSVSVAYDAMLVLATSCDQVFTAHNEITASNLETAIAHQNIIGISGRISFRRNGPISGPDKKIIVVIRVVNMKFKYADFKEGTFV